MAGIKVKRPLFFSIVCIHSWIPVLIAFVVAFSPAVKKAGQFYPVLYCLTDCMLFISLIGAWYMKKWGVELFIVAFFSNNILLLLMDQMSYSSYTFLSEVLFITVGMIFYRRMDSNL